MQKLTLDRPLIVEGVYDKNTVSQVADGIIVTTDGFGVFHRPQRVAWLRRLCEPRGVLVLTDSDAGGGQIRRFLAEALPKDKVTHLYVPQIPGRERRKKERSRAGYLGVEGMEADLLRRLLAPYTSDAPPRPTVALTKADLYALGLSGREDSARRRAEVLGALGLPKDLTCNALLAAVNTVVAPADWQAALRGLGDDADA
ncbi:MAG: DUF4093 domain-containing protein [Clostridia bacterium]|nr:DUF4093 domain-containing protein [Clostridia bacterium]